MSRKRINRRNFGTVDQLKSGKYRARYLHPHTGERISGPVTYTNKTDADTWLQSENLAIVRGTWQDYRLKTPTLNDYGRPIIENKPKPKTVEVDLQIWNTHIAPYLGTIRVADLTVSHVNTWHSDRKQHSVGARALSKAYGVLRNVMNHAVREELRLNNPCKIVGAGNTNSPERPHLTPEEVNALSKAVEPRYEALVLVLAYCALRKGEATALRRGDLHKDLGAGTWSLTINRKVQGQVGGGWRYGSPKTRAGVRTISLAQSLVPILEQHLNAYVRAGNDELVFTSSTGAPAYKSGSEAIKKALKTLGIDEMNGLQVHTHDLRHSGATWLVQAGHTIPELQRYLGDDSAHAAMRYAHASGTNTHLAESMNALYESTV